MQVMSHLYHLGNVSDLYSKCSFYSKNKIIWICVERIWRSYIFIWKKNIKFKWIKSSSSLKMGSIVIVNRINTIKIYPPDKIYDIMLVYQFTF